MRRVIAFQSIEKATDEGEIRAWKKVSTLLHSWTVTYEATYSCKYLALPRSKRAYSDNMHSRVGFQILDNSNKPTEQRREAVESRSQLVYLRNARWHVQYILQGFRKDSSASTHFFCFMLQMIGELRLQASRLFD